MGLGSLGVGLRALVLWGLVLCAPAAPSPAGLRLRRSAARTALRLLVPPGGESQALACFPSVLAQSSAAQFAPQGMGPPARKEQGGNFTGGGATDHFANGR